MSGTEESCFESCCMSCSYRSSVFRYCSSKASRREMSASLSTPDRVAALAGTPAVSAGCTAAMADSHNVCLYKSRPPSTNTHACRCRSG